MKIHLYPAVYLFMSFSSLLATEYFVHTDGRDTNNGRSGSPDGAWRTLAHAVEQIQAGDTLHVGPGTYAGPSIILSGLHATRDSPTRLVSTQPLGAAITRHPGMDSGTSVVVISDCSHLEMTGFEVYDHPEGMESGIDVRDGCHHITIRDCHVHDCGCGGISSRTSDYLLFENNIVRGNAKRNQWNCSGISVWHPIEHDQEPGYHIIYRGNIVYENECELPFKPLGHDVPTDGNGMIIDDLRNTQGGGQEGGYKAATLIENNFAFNNGGRGINVYESDNVTIRNNVSYHNMRVISRYNNQLGDVTIENSSGVTVENNLIVQHPDYPSNAVAVRCYTENSGNNRITGNTIIGRTNYCGEDLVTHGNRHLASPAQSFATGRITPPKLVHPNTGPHETPDPSPSHE